MDADVDFDFFDVRGNGNVILDGAIMNNGGGDGDGVTSVKECCC